MYTYNNIFYLGTKTVVSTNENIQNMISSNNLHMYGDSSVNQGANAADTQIDDVSNDNECEDTSYSVASETDHNFDIELQHTENYENEHDHSLIIERNGCVIQASNGNECEGNFNICLNYTKLEIHWPVSAATTFLRANCFFFLFCLNVLFL